MNPRATNLLAVETPEECLGLRPGEALGCLNVAEGPMGCHSSRFCRQCGAVAALDKAQESGEGREECNLFRVRADCPETLNLSVLAVSVAYGEQDYIVFSVIDETENREREAMEQIFFHDVLNLAGGVHGMMEIMNEPLRKYNERAAETVLSATERLINEIRAQKVVSEAKNGQLDRSDQGLRSRRFLEELTTLYQGYWPNGPKIRVAPQCVEIEFLSDPALLGRVLGNMIKNAAEASQANQVVTLHCDAADERLQFSVHNETAIPKELRLNVFRRGFSTKGKGRGMGMHSIKLLGERYLGGTVGFRTSEDKGTLFYLNLPRG